MNFKYLGIPEVYLQTVGQNEDQLTVERVKNGFIDKPIVKVNIIYIINNFIISHYNKKIFFLKNFNKNFPI